jgi:hypothetical protein
VALVKALRFSFYRYKQSAIQNISLFSKTFHNKCYKNRFGRKQNSVGQVDLAPIFLNTLWLSTGW